MADPQFMSRADISLLKETLNAPQQLLQKLYNELDAEREASATAASEALSVILRLQGEKAAVKMEAEQYKRLSEEEMCHTEESLTIIEDIIYQKEMEIASLDYQVQAYRYKLLSMGCVDPGVGEIKFPENLLQRNEKSLNGETCLQTLGRRNSAPVLLKFKKNVIKRESSPSLENDSIDKVVDEQETSDQALDLYQKMDNLTPGCINSYKEQIRKLDVRVKEIAGPSYVNSDHSHSSVSSRLSTYNSCDPSVSRNETRSPSPQDMKKMKHSAYLLKDDMDVHCTSAHNVFEVPQVDRTCISPEPLSKDSENTVYKGHSSLESDVSSQSCAKDEPDWLKKLLQSTNRGNSLCRPSDIAALDCRLNVIKDRNGVYESQSRMNRQNMMSEIVEVGRSGESVIDRDEVLTLLNEIKCQINDLHCEIMCQKVRKFSVRDEPSLRPLAEAMLYFWP